LQENSRENQLNWNSLLPCALKLKRGIPKPSGIVSLIMVSVILTALSSIINFPVVDVYADQDYDYFTIEQTLPNDLSSQGNSAIPPNGEEEQQQLVWPPFPEIINQNPATLQPNPPLSSPLPPLSSQPLYAPFPETINQNTTISQPNPLLYSPSSSPSPSPLQSSSPLPFSSSSQSSLIPPSTAPQPSSSMSSPSSPSSMYPPNMQVSSGTAGNPGPYPPSVGSVNPNSALDCDDTGNEDCEDQGDEFDIENFPIDMSPRNIS
jgi:hypothetical protein